MLPSYKSVLITGGAGFVGSSLALDLKSRYPVLAITAFDNLRRRGSELNLTRLKRAGIRFVHGDVRSVSDLAAAGPVDLIIECSAEPSAQAGMSGAPDYVIGTNLTGCYRCLELARQYRSDFFFVSTSRVYPFSTINCLRYHESETRFVLAEQQPVPGASSSGVDENFPLPGARTIYGMTKLAAELLVEEYRHAYGVRSIVNRCGLIAGPWQMGKSDQGVVTLWAARHYFKRSLDYIGFGGSGKQVRDILHVSDFCDLIVEQITSFEDFAGATFNVGGGLEGSLSLRELTRLCEELSGNRLGIGSVVEERPGDMRIYISDCRRIMEASRWRPRRSPKVVVQDIFEWIGEHEEPLKAVLDD